MATLQKPEELVMIDTVSTLLDGKTPGKTYQNSDRRVAQCYPTNGMGDAMEVMAKGVGNPDGYCDFIKWGYSKNGAARMLYSGRATLGTAVASATEKYIDTFSADPEYHSAPIKIRDIGENRVCRMDYDFKGLSYVMYEAVRFVNMTSITFLHREYGFK